MSRPWMPFYVGDYLKDTRRLNTLQHGIYMLLIMDYWSVGKLPDDDNQLAQIAGLSVKQWQCNRNAIASMFLPGWKHKRVEEELAKAADVSIKRKANAEKRWCKSNANAYANDVHHARVSQPQPQSQELEPKGSKEPDKPAPKKSRPKAVLEILEGCLSPKTASDLVEHRNLKHAPMTEKAAELLVKRLTEFGDAELAAQTMIERSWTGFKPEWMDNSPRAGPAPAGRSNGTSGFLRSVLDDVREDDRAKESFSETILNLPAIRR